MYVRDVGSGPPVLVLHGCPSTGEMVAPIQKALQDSHRVLVPDLPGYGASPPPETYSLKAVREGLLKILDERDIESLSIVGHSNGSYRALDLALHTDLNIEKLVLLGALAHLPEEMKEEFPQFATALRDGVDLEDAVVERWIAPDFRAAHPEFEEQMRTWWREMDNEVIADDLDAAVTMPDLRPRLEELEVPAYVRVGSLDLATPPELSEEIVERLPEATLDIVDGVGHFVHIEDREKTGKKLADFLTN